MADIFVAPDHHGPIPIITLGGELDRASMGSLLDDARAALAEAGPAGNGDSSKGLVLNLQGVTFIDSGALNVMYQLLEDLDGGWLGVAEASPSVSRIISISGLSEDEHFHQFASMDEARAFIESLNLQGKSPR
jgi:anti-anti-sigma factor